MRPIQRLALFDLDNTLVDLTDAFRRWAAEFTAEHGLGQEAADWLIEVDRGGSVPRAQLFADAKERFRLTGTADALLDRYRRRMPRLVRCRPQDLVALDRLRAAGWRVGVVTNGAHINQNGKIEHTGLAAHIDGWAISEAEGVRKPDPRLFEIAAGRCGGLSAADGGWHTGDSPTADVVGGHAAGLRTVWLDRGQEWPADLPRRPDRTASGVAEAVELLLTG